MSEIIIRPATLQDAATALQIYAPYVEKTAISFEYEVPSLEEFRARMEGFLKKYPYLVAARGDEILGYAYAHPFVGRAAYDYSAETTIYVRMDARKQGLGRRLYLALEAICRAQNICNLNACIGCPQVEDEYLTRNSMDFHRHLGFTPVGTFHNSGYKFGRWYNMAWMEKIIAPHPKTPEKIIPYPNLGPERIYEILKGI